MILANGVGSGRCKAATAAAELTKSLVLLSPLLLLSPLRPYDETFLFPLLLFDKRRAFIIAVVGASVLALGTVVKLLYDVFITEDTVGK